MVSGVSIRFLAWLMRLRAARGCISLSSMFERLQGLLDDGQLVGGIVDDEVPGQAEGGRFAPQQSRRQRVKRRQPNLTAVAPELLSTRCRISSAALFVNVTASTSPGLGAPGADQVRHPRGDHPRLARPGARQDEQGASVCMTASRWAGSREIEEVHGEWHSGGRGSRSHRGYHRRS